MRRDVAVARRTRCRRRSRPPPGRCRRAARPASRRRTGRSAAREQRRPSARRRRRSRTSRSAAPRGSCRSAPPGRRRTRRSDLEGHDDALPRADRRDPVADRERPRRRTRARAAAAAGTTSAPSASGRSMSQVATRSGARPPPAVPGPAAPRPTEPDAAAGPDHQRAHPRAGGTTTLREPVPGSWLSRPTAAASRSSAAVPARQRHRRCRARAPSANRTPRGRYRAGTSPRSLERSL